MKLSHIISPPASCRSPPFSASVARAADEFPDHPAEGRPVVIKLANDVAPNHVSSAWKNWPRRASMTASSSTA